MDKEEMMKMINEKFWIPSSYERLKDDVFVEDIKQFIFEEAIPEVLKSIIIKKEIIEFFEKSANSDLSSWYAYWVRTCMSEIKQKTKELYDIDL